MTTTLPSQPVWFITGCSSGFGLSLALLALKNNHKVIATSRNPSKTPALVSQVEKLGGTWMALDVSKPDVATTIEKALAVNGRIDILVNNAGFALLGAFETFTDAQCRAQLETNFFAPLQLTRLLLPAMRARRSGLIINVSSTAGIEGRASRSMYCASKFALEAFSEALYGEVKPFGVRVLLVEPGAFRSRFADNLILGQMDLPEEYKGSATEMMIEGVKNLQGGTAPGDVEKGVQAIFDVATKTGQAEGMEDFLRLPLGKDGSARWEIKLADLQRNLDGTEKIWSRTDHDDVQSVGI